MYRGAFGIARGCKSYAKLFRVFLPISRILVFAGASVQVRNSLRHCISKLGTLVASRRKVAVEYILKGLASGALKPVIDRTFKFDDMVEVHRYLESNGQFGKIVVAL